MTFSKLGTDTQTGQIVELPQASRRQGLYIIGANGTGKTGLIEHLILQDIDQGLGVGLLDPHGDLTNAILAKMTKRVDDVILLDIQDEDHPFGLNIFECSNPQSPTAVQKIVDLVMHIFEKLYDVSRQTPRMAQFLRNCTHTLVANPGYTMADIPLLLQDGECRRKLVAQVTDPQVRLFWQTYNALKPSEQFDRAESTINKMDELLQPLPRNIVGQGKTTVNIQQVMDERKILLVKLSAQLDQVTSLVGTLLIALFLNAAYSRASIPINKRKQFNLYADEFQRFATEDFATLLTEARKFGVATTIAHQARYQPGMTDGIRAVSLQAANHVVFRVTSPDADELAGGFDITPQAAWEEELAKEWVEILKPEWYEKKEEEVIDGNEPIRTMKQGDILQHIDRNGHSNKRVMELFTAHIKTLSGYVYPIEDHELDRFIVLGMNGQFVHTSQQARQLLLDVLKNYGYWGSLNLYSQLHLGQWSVEFRHIGNEYPNGAQTDTLLESVCAALAWNKTTYIYTCPSSMYDRLREAEYYHVLKNLFYKAMALYLPGWDNEPMTQAENMHKNAEETRKITEDAELQHVWDSLAQFGDANHPYNKLYRKFSDEKAERMLYLYRNGLNDPDPVMGLRKSKAWQQAIEAVQRLEVFIWGVTQLVYELSKSENHILEDSGQQQPRKRKQINYLTHPPQTLTHPRKVIMHPQRTYQDVKTDIANQLSGLPNFTARVKISEHVPQNPGKKCRHCGKLSNPGALHCSGCGKKLPNEYTLTTLKPLVSIGKTALQQRLTTIQINNIQKGYMRDRITIEAEILNRQISCSGGAAPAQPQKPQQQQAGHARQVPVQGHCPNCNATNPRGSKFCNQCGTKL